MGRRGARLCALGRGLRCVNRAHSRAPLRIQTQRPPSTSKQTPVKKFASSEQRKTAPVAMSSGVERRPSGTVLMNASRVLGPKNEASSGVSPATGHSALTRILSGANSTAIDLVITFTAPFEEL